MDHKLKTGQTSSLLSLNLSKCWQGKEPWLCFQATINVVTRGTLSSETMRHRGYFIVDARRTHAAFTWTTEKPDALVTAGAASNIIRKYIPSGRVTELVLGTPENPEAFSGLLLYVPVKGVADNYDRFFLGVHNDQPPTMELAGLGCGLDEAVSYLRWHEKGLFTVRKTADHGLFQLLKEPSRGETISSLLEQWIRPEASKPEPKDGGPTLLPLHQRQARDRISRRLKTLQKTLRQDEGKIPDQAGLALLKLHASLFQAWIHMVKPNMFELTLTPEETGLKETLSIPLDPDKSPGEQLNALFHKLRRSEKAFEMGSKRLLALKSQIRSFQETLLLLSGTQAMSERETIGLLQEAGLAPKESSSGKAAVSHATTATLGRVFTSQDGAFMRLGRSATENDAITKSAKSNDWWVHTSGGVHGTHVVIARKSLKSSTLPASTRREAAILAVHFSDLALSRSGEVYVTTRGQLKKRKGMAPGLWQIDRTETMVVRYDERELAEIFSRELRAGLQRPIKTGLT